MGHLEKLSSWFEAFEHDRRRFLDPRTRERDRRDVERAHLAAHGGLTSVAVRLGLQSLVPSHRRAAAVAKAREGDRVFAKGIRSTLGDAALLAGRFVDAAAQYRKAAELTSPADGPPPKPRSARDQQHIIEWSWRHGRGAWKVGDIQRFNASVRAALDPAVWQLVSRRSRRAFPPPFPT
jgi:hypothetical protein